MWKQIDKHWSLTPGLSRDLIDRIGDRNHQMVLMELNFYSEPLDPSRLGPYGPPSQDAIRETWIVLPGHRTQASVGAVGELQRVYRSTSPPSAISSDWLQTMIAAVISPEQPTSLAAKWDIRGLDKVAVYCRSRNR